MKANKFEVVSYDPDEQQTFFDWVLAATKADAKEFIETQRDYASVVEVLDLADLQDVVDRFKNATAADIVSGMNELVRNNSAHSDFFEEKELAVSR